MFRPRGGRLKKVGCFLGFRKTVDAVEVAAIRDADPQVANDTVVRVLKNPGAAHGVAPLGGELVSIGTIFTVPSLRTSTFRSALLASVGRFCFLFM